MPTNMNFPSGAPTGNVYVDSLIWGGSLSAGSDTQTTITWAVGGNEFVREGSGYVWTTPWTSYELVALKSALQQWSNVANIKFVQGTDPDLADLEEFTVSTNNMNIAAELFPGEESVFGLHEAPGDSRYVPQYYGFYNYEAPGWDSEGLQKGGNGFLTLVHELGHALGLAHPHDGGTRVDSTTFPDVTSSFDSYGKYDLNQGIWTAMSYNDGWNQRPSDSNAYGREATPMAFDVAAIQYIYGVNTSFHTDNDIYVLPSINQAATYWSCIWDAGGDDTITAQGISTSCVIDLREAPLTGPNAGGYISSVNGVVGGFTIAKNATIENAIGGYGDDSLVGNAYDNYLDGGVGTDKMYGGDGNDLYVVDNTSDVITENENEGNDWVETTLARYSLAENVEGVNYFGDKTKDFYGVGNDLNNIIWGWEGNDTLDGGAGDDSMEGDLGNDLYYADSIGDIVTEKPNEGIDQISTTLKTYSLASIPNVEYLEFIGSGKSSLYGSIGDNIIWGGSGNDLINGDEGNDHLYGYGGNDTINGGSGLDVAFFNAAIAAIKVNMGKGTVVGEGKDKLIDIEEVFGTRFNDQFIGGGKNDTFDGFDGADTFNGKGGNDIYVGGNGADKFVFDTGLDAFANLDSIKDFETSADTIYLSKKIFTAYKKAAVLADKDFALFDSGDGETAANAKAMLGGGLTKDSHFIFDNYTSDLYYDKDGNGSATAIKFANIVGVMNTADFHIY